MNHEQMIRTRARKIAGITREIPKTEVFGAERGELLVLGWGGTYGALREGVRQLREQGHAVGHAHLRYLNPLPGDLGDLLGAIGVSSSRRSTWTAREDRAREYLVDAIGFNRCRAVRSKWARSSGVA